MNIWLSRFSQPGALCRVMAAVASAVFAALVIFAIRTPGVYAQAPGYVQVSAGGGHTCATQQYFTTPGGAVACWGHNDFGQAADRAGSFTAVSAGLFHTCALRSDGHVECWGSNERNVCTDTWCPYYTGQASPPVVIFAQISAGSYHSCGLRPEGSVDCWGDNMYGMAADKPGPYAQVSAGDDHTCALAEDGHVDCWGENTKGRAQGRTGIFSQVSAGGSHNCAVRQSDGKVECWGGNAYGQSNPPDLAFIQVSAGNLHTCGLSVDHRVVCWGYNLYGQVGKAPSLWFKQVASGMGHSCAVTGTNEVYCWGRNDYKQATVPGLGGPVAMFDFSGFFPPVQAEPVLNVVKAGSAVPLKFSLGGDKGLDVIAVGNPASGPLDCATLDPGEDSLAPVQPAGGSGLSYDASTGQYTYIWKTEKAWAGTCRVLSLTLKDETEHRIAFRFK